MSYLVCESCGKHYELEEGISSFSHEKCECGGRLRYSDGMVLNSNNSPSVNRSNSECPNCGSINPNNPPVCAVCGTKLRDMPVKNRSPNKISILGVGAGLGFLMISAIFDVLVIFGNNIPQQANNIPHNLLREFGALFLCLTIFSGLISSYISSNTSYNNGLINGALVGIILGLVLGVISGSALFIYMMMLLGSFSAIGGLLGTFLYRKIN